MTSSLILAHGRFEARSRVYQYYGVSQQPEPRGFLEATISAVGCGARRLASAITSVPRHIDRAVSRATGIDLAWSSGIVTLGSAGYAFAYREPFRAYAAWHLHDRPGHFGCFAAVNATIDSVAGKNHRLKYGHTIFWLPSLIQTHGVIAIPGYAVHVLQDFTTVAGFPLFPGARLAAIGLRKAGLRSAVATGFVTVNLAGAIGLLSAGLLTYELASLGCEVVRQARRKSRDRRPPDPQTVAEVFAKVEQALERVARDKGTAEEVNPATR